MATLTETAYYTRKTINWAIIVLIGYILAKLLWGLITFIFLLLFPPKPIPPNHAFGPLPTIEFPESTTQKRQLTYVLETISGDLPKASESAVVFFMPKRAPNLRALANTQNFAERLGLDPKPTQETSNLYTFNDTSSPLRTLRYDIVSKNFILRYQYEQDMGLFQEKNLPTSEAAEAEARSILQTYNLLEPDLLEGSSVVTFLKLQGTSFIRATSLSQADALRVDFFRQSLYGLPVLTPYPGEGAVAMIFSGSTTLDKKILQIAYTYWPIDKNTVGTYTLKSMQVAWQELQNDQGYIAQYPTTGTQVTIRNVYLAYYDSFTPQDYLQPIYVFEGDHGFVGYIHAIHPEWVEQEEENN